LERTPINKPTKEVTITATITKRQPTDFAIRAARNPMPRNKEKTTPYRNDLSNGTAGNKTTLITGTNQMGKNMIKMTNRHLHPFTPILHISL
jgi:hypothetical protein